MELTRCLQHCAVMLASVCVHVASPPRLCVCAYPGLPVLVCHYVRSHNIYTFYTFSRAVDASVHSTVCLHVLEGSSFTAALKHGHSKKVTLDLPLIYPPSMHTDRLLLQGWLRNSWLGLRPGQRDIAHHILAYKWEVVATLSQN